MQEVNKTETQKNFFLVRSKVKSNAQQFLQKYRVNYLMNSK